MTLPVVAVACGVLRRAGGEVLIAQRPAGKIAAGKWEFPGGKIEFGEDAGTALRRELREELGIQVSVARPLIRVSHDYTDRRVLLDTWLVGGWQGEIHAHEKQAFAWVQPQALSSYDLLAADQPIVTALRLPPCYVFTPADAAIEKIHAGLPVLPAAALLRLRLPKLDDQAYVAVAKVLLPEVRRRGLRLILDRGPSQVGTLGADGWHGTASALTRLRVRPAGLVLASCHSVAEVLRAREFGVDAVVLGPVQKTTSHPDTEPLGWRGFHALSHETNVPAYAIGGLAAKDLETAYRHYAQGVAGISAFWSA